jgi:hypothetical protein
MENGLRKGDILQNNSHESSKGNVSVMSHSPGLPNTIMVRMRVRLAEALDELENAKEELEEIKKNMRYTRLQEVEVRCTSLGMLNDV